MRKILCFTSVVALLAITSIAYSQGPGRPGRGGSNQMTVESFLARLKVFDANQDGSISGEEMTDSRLLPLVKRADKDGDGVATKDELVALFEQESSEQRGGFRGGPRGGGPGDGGPQGGPGMGSFPPAGGPGGPPAMQPGQVLPEFLAAELELTAPQKKQLEALQKLVDKRLKSILTDDQLARLQQMSQQGPGLGGPGRGGPGMGFPGRGPGGPRPQN